MTICQYGTKYSKYKISHPKNCPKTFKLLPKWRNFAKSGHTECDLTDNIILSIQRIIKHLIETVVLKMYQDEHDIV